MKVILKNITYLYIIQMINQLFPFILFPILISKIGLHDFGIFQFALSFSAFIFVFLDYGHNLNASREIAILKKEKRDISRYFCIIMSSRMILFLISFVIINLLIFSSDILSEYTSVLSIFWLYTLGMVLFPIWFFQGIEKMLFPLLVQLGFKILLLTLVIKLVSGVNALSTVSWIYSIVTLLQSLIILHLIFKYMDIKFIIPLWNEITRSLIEGKTYFYAQGATALFSSINPILIGIFSTPSVVGIYTLADRIVRSVVMLVGAINRIIYPISAKLFYESFEKGVAFIKKVSKIGGLIMLSVSIILFLISPFIANYFVGNSSKDLTIFIKILAILPFTIFINNIFGNQILLNINETKKFSYIIYSTIFVSGVSMIVLVPLIGGIGVAIASLISEIYIAIATFVISTRVLKKHEVNYFEI